ncbi:MAG TPA: lysophospholipid acyltransferase family protein [Candidatus Thermoplasmatota archaeon]|nr:lysophospholipid acyltransferase family protein [Candidatus Thermoplasmatota archaeon]
MGERFYRASQYTIAPVLRGLWRVHATGLHHIPATGGAILASNHLSYSDHYFLPAVVPRQVFFISKAQHFDVPVQRWLFEQWGVIPLRRGEGDNEAMARSLQVLNEGKLLGIYPEGTRSTDGKLHKGRTGVARLALQARVPIVPVGMIGTEKVLPKGKHIPTFHKVVIHIGAPIDVSQFYGMENDRKVCREITDRVMHAIRDLSGQEYVHEYMQNPEYQAKADADAKAEANKER